MISIKIEFEEIYALNTYRQNNISNK